MTVWFWVGLGLGLAFACVAAFFLLAIAGLCLVQRAVITDPFDGRGSFDRWEET